MIGSLRSRVIRRAHAVARPVVGAFWLWAAPVSLGVRTMVIRDDTVMLVRHAQDGQWYLPGGGVKRRETLLEALARELREETRLVVEPESERIVGVYSSSFEGKSDHIVVFTCTAKGDLAPDLTEIDDAAFFTLTHLPATTSPGTRRRLADLAGCTPVSGAW